MESTGSSNSSDQKQQSSNMNKNDMKDDERLKVTEAAKEINQVMERSRSSTFDDDDQELHNSMKLQDGKEVYLTHEAKRIFKARYEYCSPQQTVHFQTIGKHQARFFIIEVFRNATSWICFDEDIHSAGAAIMWCLKNVEK